MPESGRRLEATVRAAMAATTEARTVADLAKRAHVQRATVYAAFRGRPLKPATMEAIAYAVGRPVGDLWAAWDGSATAPPTLASAIATLAEELREWRLGREDVEARLRALEAAKRLAAPDAQGQPGRSAPRGTAG